MAAEVRDAEERVEGCCRDRAAADEVDLAEIVAAAAESEQREIERERAGVEVVAPVRKRQVQVRGDSREDDAHSFG